MIGSIIYHISYQFHTVHRTKAEVRYHARRYGKVSDALEVPSAALTTFEDFVQSNNVSVKEMFPGATPTGRRYLLDSKWKTLKPSIKATFFQIAEKDAARYDWEKKVYLAIREYRTPKHQPPLTATARRLSNENVKAVFDCVRNNRPPPADLPFHLVNVGPEGSTLSPPSIEFDGTT